MKTRIEIFNDPDFGGGNAKQAKLTLIALAKKLGIVLNSVDELIYEATKSDAKKLHLYLSTNQDEEYTDEDWDNIDYASWYALFPDIDAYSHLIPVDTRFPCK